jgi:hypothetical protein
MGTIRVLAPIALFPGAGLAAFHDLIALTIGAGNWHEYHGIPSIEEGISMAYRVAKLQI